MSLLYFFNGIEILPFGETTLSTEHTLDWNIWVRSQKERCIEKIRANAVKPPQIKVTELKIFFDTLIAQGLLD
jgi:hypothetical protein